MTKKELEDKESMLSKEQQEVIDLVLSGKNLCVLGAGGTGKTFLLTILVEELRKRLKNVLVCAFTGVAANHAGGITVHSAFNFDRGPAFRQNGKLLEHATNSIRQTDVIIIDEISMLRMDYFDSITASVRKANGERRVMGLSDIQLIVIGDFYQLPPVLTDDERDVLDDHYGYEVGEGFSFQARFWNSWDFDIFQLNDVFRQNDPEFIKHLNELRVGDSSCLSYFNLRVGPAQKDAISLYPTRRERDEANIKMLQGTNEVDDKDIIFYAYYSADVYKDDFPMVEDSLHLRINAPVMFLTNYNAKSRECEDLSTPDGARKNIFSKEQKNPMNLYHNGDIGYVVSYLHGEKAEDDSVVVKLNGHYLQLSRHEFVCYDYVFDKKTGKTKLKKKGSCQQLPLMLAFSSTIHKFQGQTVQKANIMPETFASGQLYVALSRCQSFEGLTLLREITEQDILVSDAVKKFYDSI